MFKGKNYINGQWETTQESYSKINPATGDVLGIFPETKEDTLEDLTQQLMDNPESTDSEIPEESLESIVEKLDESEKEEE